jgi:hypothetical protein
LKSRGGQAAKSVRVIARENAKSDSDEV